MWRINTEKYHGTHRAGTSPISSRPNGCRSRGNWADLEIGGRVPSMGGILLDERSQPGPMTATVAKRKA
jgi:hypothetical protein